MPLLSLMGKNFHEIEMDPVGNEFSGFPEFFSFLQANKLAWDLHLTPPINVPNLTLFNDSLSLSTYLN